jgi:hypothetical protein
LPFSAFFSFQDFPGSGKITGRKQLTVETPLNTYTRSWLFLLLLGSAVTLLPACGTKTNVNSEKAHETVLNAEETPVSSGEMSGTPVHTYVEKIHRTRGPKSTTSIITTPITAEGVTTPATQPLIPNQTPPVESSVPVKRSGGSHWKLWVLVVLVLAGIGWYFWTKSRENHTPTQPTPPTGGLSPVSGFTAIKDRIEDDSESKPSIWSKKIF